MLYPDIISFITTSSYNQISVFATNFQSLPETILFICETITYSDIGYYDETNLTKKNGFKFGSNYLL